MRLFVTVLFLLSIASVCCGQRVRYKDLFPLEESMSSNELKNSLKEYIADDADHPHANFRLALVYETNYKTGDLLTDFEQVTANAEQCRLRLVKVKLLVDEREVSRNNEFYFTTFKIQDSKGKPAVPFILVQKKLKDSYDSAEIFLKITPPIYKNFTNAVYSYDKAVKLFAQINSDFLSLDDLFLFYDDTLDKQLLELKSSYDSARFYFDQYRELIKVYPITYHHQTYSVKPIVTFRLDGLITRMNFLTDKVEFWDYGAWVDQIRKSVRSEIAALRAKLIQNQDQLDATLAKIKGSTGEVVPLFKLDKELVFNLNNYDKQSLVLGLLEYKAYLQKSLLQARMLQVDTINRERNAEVYSTFIYSNRSADTLIEVVKSRLTKEKIRKHNDFLLKYYGNGEALRKYTLDEQTEIKRLFEQNLASLRSELLQIAVAPKQASVPQPAVKMIRFGKLNINPSIGIPAPEVLDKGEAVTLEIKKAPDGTTYLSGIHKPDKKLNNVVVFVAQLTADGRPAWVKNFDYKVDTLSPASDANNLPGPLSLTREGCAVMIHSVQAVQKTSMNTFVYLNEKGEEKIRKRMKDSGYPRKIGYDEKSNSFVIVLKGQEERQFFAETEPASLVGINVLGDVMWTRSVDLAGTVTELINVIDGYLVVGNFMILKDQAGKEFRTKVNAGESNPYVVKLNSQGDIIKIVPLAVPKSIFLTRVIKINDNSINLIGWETTFDQGINRTLSGSDAVITIMTNHTCQVVCSSL